MHVEEVCDSLAHPWFVWREMSVYSRARLEHLWDCLESLPCVPQHPGLACKSCTLMAHSTQSLKKIIQEVSCPFPSSSFSIMVKTDAQFQRIKTTLEKKKKGWVEDIYFPDLRSEKNKKIKLLVLPYCVNIL